MLSIIIPCFNEEKVIFENINKILSWSNEQKFESELLLINNASTDKTLQEMDKFNKQSNVKILNEKRKGKGFAVKKGLMNSKFTKAVILDADLSASINELNNNWLERDNLLIIGSRPLGNEINTPKIRKLSGYILNYLIRKIFKLNFRDTQCGFKYLSTKNRGEIAEQITCGGFLYDLDLILNCLRLGIIVQEEPVKYNFNRDSSVSLLKDPLIMLKDIYILNKKYK
tara:strand:+ start:1757 stop:2437 length:681 start_codon:yes stop_codon:yes gene_type:complete